MYILLIFSLKFLSYTLALSKKEKTLTITVWKRVSRYVCDKHVRSRVYVCMLVCVCLRKKSSVVNVSLVKLDSLKVRPHHERNHYVLN